MIQENLKNYNSKGVKVLPAHREGGARAILFYMAAHFKNWPDWKARARRKGGGGNSASPERSAEAPH